MTRIITALILIPLVVLAVFKAPFWVLALLTALIALIATAEYLDIVAGYRFVPMRALTLALTGIFFFFTIAGSFLATPNLPAFLHTASGAMAAGLALRTVAFLFTFLAILYLIAALRLQPLASFLPSAAMSALAIAYISIPLEHLLLVRNSLRNGSLLVMYGLLVVWAGDVFALYAGRSFGKHKLAPVVSPKKTWEGAVASFVGSVLIGGFLLVKNGAVADFWTRLHLVDAVAPSQFMTATPWTNALVASAVLNLAAQLGDLAESAMKRGANLKDSGSLLPGHGGILDRIDAILFAAPVLWYFASFQFIHY